MTGCVNFLLFLSFRTTLPLILNTWCALSVSSRLFAFFDSTVTDTHDVAMFRRSFASKDRANKAGRWIRKKKHSRHSKMKMQDSSDSPPLERPVASPVVVLVASLERRTFVAHEHILSDSPYFSAILKDMEGHTDKVVELPDEEPEILSCVLEFLYKGDYFPRLLYNELESSQDSNTGGRGSSEATMFHSRVGEVVLRDTVVYCAAEKYGLEELKRLAIRKQGLQSGISVGVILRSARYAYDNTPDSDSQLRAHYLAMVIRTRDIFKRSGTMQIEMEKGHGFFFDVFVAMCNHMDDLEDVHTKRPRKMF